MSLRIQPHDRLHEWVADELGYFADEGLDYTLVDNSISSLVTPPRDEAGQIKGGAYEAYEAGREAEISCACHWVVNNAATNQMGKLVANAYSVAPCAIVVAPESEILIPEDLAGVPIGVGYHSGSHFTTLQALEGVLDSDDIKLSFEGSPQTRLDSLLDRSIPAATLFGLQLYIAEAYGFRKVIDSSFMIAFLADSAADPLDVERYVNGLRRAQMEIDLHPERYKHFHLKSIPEKYQDKVDVRQFGIGERIVFLPYTGDTYESTQEWIQKQEIFGPAAEIASFAAITI